MTTPTYAQRGCRFREDVSGVTWIAAENAGGSWAIDSNFRIRIEVENTNNSNGTPVLQIWASRNGGAYAQVTGAGTYIRPSLSDQFTDSDADNTDRLATATTTFDEGVLDEDGTQTVGVTKNNHVEVEYCLKMQTACSAGDYFDFRVYNNGSPLASGYSYTIRITATVADLTISMGAVSLASSAQSATVSAVGPQTINMGYASLTGAAQSLSVSAVGVTVAQLIGFETGGLQEAMATSGSPVVDTTRVRTGTYSLNMSSAGTYYINPDPMGLLSDDSMGYCVEFYANFDTNTPGAAYAWFRCYSNYPTNTNWSFALRLNTDGTITFSDVVSNLVSTSGAISADEDHKFQIYWEYADGSASWAFYLDDSEIGSGTTGDFVTGVDPSFYGDGAYLFSSDGSNMVDYFVDDFVHKIFCTGISDRYSNAFEVIGGYQNTAEDNLDQGSTLDDGTWADASEIPFADDTTPNLATYTGNGDAGHMRTDEGTRSGPGSALTGTPRAASFIHRMDFLGTSTPVYQRIGKYTSGGSDSYSDETVTPTTSPVNYKFITQSSSYVPQTTSDYFVLGMSLQVASQEIYLHEAVAFLLQEVSDNPTISMGYITTTASAQALSVVPGSISVQAAVATLASSPLALTVSAPPPAQNIGMGYANMVASIESLSVQAGQVTVVMGYATLASSPQALTLQAGAIQVTMGYVTLTGSAEAASVSVGASTIQMGYAALLSAAQALSVVPGAVSVALGAATLSGSLETANITIGASTISMGYVELTSSIQVLDAVPGEATISMGAATLASSAQAAIVTAGASIIQMSAVTLASSPQASTIVPGAAVIQAGYATLAGTINALQVVSVAAPQIIPMGYATLASSSQSLTVVPGAVSLSMSEISLTGSPQALSVSLSAFVLAMGYMTLAGSLASLEVDVEASTRPSIWQIGRVIRRETTAQRYNKLNRLGY